MDKITKDDRRILTCKDCKLVKDCKMRFKSDRAETIRCTEFKRA